MKIFAALDDDIGAGFVWMAKIADSPRCVVKITNPANGHRVYCEALNFETNFVKRYNQSPRFSITDQSSSIVMGGWYRARLGVETQKDYPLRIEVADGLRGKLCACLDHPQIIVRVAAWLGIISVGLGTIGVLLGAISVWPHG